MRNRTVSVGKLALLAMLISLALVLSALERMLPMDIIIPVPGIKLGLPNLITLFAVFYLDFLSACSIVIIRCFLAALLFGGVTGFFFSLLGGIFALLTMWMVKYLFGKYVSSLGTSIAGAAFHNIGQIAAASIMLKSLGVFGYLPLLLVSSIGTGFLTGVVFYTTDRKLSKIGFIKKNLSKVKTELI